MASTIPDLVQAYLSEPPQDSGDSVHLQAPQASTSSTFPSHSSSIASGSSSTRIPSEIASLIASKSLLNHPAGASATGVGGGGTLLDVVRASQEWLTSDEDAKRGRGINLLADVIGRCPKDAVTRQETRTLADFFTSCLTTSTPLSDAILVPTIQGLLHLSKLPHFSATETISLCRAIFTTVELVGRPQTTRYLIYQLFDSLMAHQRRALKRMGKEFLSGYSRLVTGEKDPRNLRTAFSIARVILVEFEISENVEDLFDITFCYFPITFTPPPNDPYGITSEELQAALRSCLSATPRFGPLALPLFIDKLAASTSTAKRQTLQAVIEAFPVYGKAVVETHANTFWEAFSVEIFHATEADIEELALSALRMLLRTIYPDEDAGLVIPDDRKASVAWKICDVCLLELNDSDKSNAVPATKILKTSLGASGAVAKYILPKVFGHLLHIYKLPDEVQQRPSVFSVMATLLEGLSQCPVPDPAEPFKPFREEVLSMATSGLRNPATRAQSLRCLVQLVLLPGCLDADERVFALQRMTDLLTRSPEEGRLGPGGEETEDASDSALDGLVNISAAHPADIESVVLPPLFNALPEDLSTQAQPLDLTVADGIRTSLGALADLCIIAPLSEVLVIRIISRIEGVARTVLQSGSSAMQSTAADHLAHPDSLSSAQYAHYLLLTLLKVLEKKVAVGHPDVAKHSETILPRLYTLAMRSALSATPPNAGDVMLDARVLEDIARISIVLVRQMDLPAQKTWLSKLWTAFMNGQPNSLILAHDASSKIVEAASTAVSKDLPWSETTSRLAQRNIGILFLRPLLALRKEAFESSPDVSRLISMLLNKLPDWTRTDPRFSAGCKLLASLFNKKADTLGSFTDESLSEFWAKSVVSTSEGGLRSLARPRAALQVYAWALRGLIVRSDSRAYTGIAQVLGLFRDNALKQDAARTLAIMGAEKDGALTKENFVVSRLLYKQRFFSFILPKLVENYHAAQDSSAGAPYLIGLSCLLQSMPKQTSISELPKLLPLLLRALDLPELDLRAHVIDTLSLLVRDAPESIKPQAGSIVAVLLKNVVCSDPANDTEAWMQLRLSAIRCLAVFPDTIDWLSLHQQKHAVLKTLGQAVDDGKRRVRREAVDCRARWFLFKAP